MLVEKEPCMIEAMSSALRANLRKIGDYYERLLKNYIDSLTEASWEDIALPNLPNVTEAFSKSIKLSILQAWDKAIALEKASFWQQSWETTFSCHSYRVQKWQLADFESIIVISIQELGKRKLGGGKQKTC